MYLEDMLSRNILILLSKIFFIKLYEIVSLAVLIRIALQGQLIIVPGYVS